MSGKDLFVGMSFVDARFVDEAENKTLPRRNISPWIKQMSMAACLTLVLFSAMCIYHLYPFAGRNITEVAQGESAADADSPGECAPGQIAPGAAVEGNLAYGKEQAPQDVPGDGSAAKAPEMMVRILKFTETGFVGIVRNHGGFTVFEDGTEITVTVYLETDPNFWPEDYQIGDLVHVMYTTWDADERTVVASILGIVEEPICD